MKFKPSIGVQGGISCVHLVYVRHTDNIILLIKGLCNPFIRNEKEEWHKIGDWVWLKASMEVWAKYNTWPVGPVWSSGGLGGYLGTTGSLLSKAASSRATQPPPGGILALGEVMDPDTTPLDTPCLPVHHITWQHDTMPFPGPRHGTSCRNLLSTCR